MTSKAISNVPRALKLSNEAYDSINKVATIVIPALLAFYAVIADTFNIPNTDKVTIITGAFIVLVKSLLEASKRAYEKSGAAAVQAIENLGGASGTLVVDTVNPEKDTVTLDLGVDHPLDLAQKDLVILKVDNSANTTDPRLIDNSGS